MGSLLVRACDMRHDWFTIGSQLRIVGSCVVNYWFIVGSFVVYSWFIIGSSL